jgi:sugar O-acyltransferase (sialic acid O-acetyltransferase NeuD family)
MNLYGASGHCKVVIDTIQSQKEKVVIENVFDDNPKFNSIASIPVTKANLELFIEKKDLIISIGNNLVRKKIAQSIVANYKKAIHANSIVSPSASIKEGTVVFAGAIINADAQIGSHCIINSGAVVEHDCIINDFVHVSPKATLGGNVLVGEGSHIGIGAAIIQGITIGKWAIVGAGAVVIKDIPDYATAVGNPAKVIKIYEPIK